MEIEKKGIPRLNLGSTNIQSSSRSIELAKESENKHPGESASQKPRKEILGRKN